MTDGQEDVRSLYVSGIVKDNGNYVFLIKEPEQWQVDENGKVRLPFGTIETSVNKGESAESALLREFRDEIGVEAKIVNSETSHLIYHDMIDEMSMNAKNNKPLFIYKDEKVENNRRKLDYIYSFLADAGGFEQIRPHNKNAVLLMDKKLLNKAAKGKLSIGDLKKNGGKIISEFELPEEALLYPTASSKGVYLCGRCH